MKNFYFIKDAEWRPFNNTDQIVEPRLSKYIQDVFERGLKTLDRNQTFKLISQLPELKKKMLLYDLGYPYEQTRGLSFEDVIKQIEKESNCHVIFMPVEGQIEAIIRPRIT